MVRKAQLTPELVREGAALLAQLDAAGMSPEIAVWLYSAEKGYWMLFFGDARVGTQGPDKIYRAIQKAFKVLKNDVAELTFNDVIAEMPDLPVFNLLRKTVRIPRGSKGFRLGPHITVDDAYIYRIKGAKRRVA